MKKYLIALVVVLLIIIAGAVYLKLSNPLTTVPGPVACTMEAKLCPDGVTSVGRQGPNCEFAECPVTQTVDETADWKTYKNDKYGFEFNYPGDWELFDLDRPQDSMSPIIGLKSPDFGSHNSINHNFYVSRLTVNKNMTIRDFYSLMLVGGDWYKEGYTPKEIFVDGLQAVRFDKVKGLLLSGGRTEVTIKTPGEFISLSIEGMSDEKIEIFNKILSTFKFAK